MATLNYSTIVPTARTVGEVQVDPRQRGSRRCGGLVVLLIVLAAIVELCNRGDRAITTVFGASMFTLCVAGVTVFAILALLAKAGF